jgi:hypothetical protein
MKDEFYIGWQDDATASYKKGRKKFFLISMLAVIFLALSYLFVEKEFVDSYFDYGNLTDVEGTIVEYPVFGISTQVNQKQVTIPLVGFGKFDALPVLENIKKQAGALPLNSFKVSLRGTMIKYQDKTWMELTEGNQSILSIKKAQKQVSQAIINKGQQSISGEIVDPKCFFGVMNPAYGKIHRSCAVRCISGGIPPILAVKVDNVYSDYYFITDYQGKPVNKEILGYVGLSVDISGNVEQVDDWKLIKIDVKNINQTATVRLDHDVNLCLLSK